MRSFVFLLMSVPLLLIASSMYLLYRYVKDKKNHKEFEKKITKDVENRYKKEYDIVIADFKELAEVYVPLVPSDVGSKLINIKHSLEKILLKMKSEDALVIKKSGEYYALMDLIYKHIPQTLKEYVEVPRDIAVKKKSVQGKTAVDLLKESAKYWDVSISEIVDGFFEDNMENLSVQKRYMENKFKK